MLLNINGQNQDLPGLTAEASLSEIIAALGLKEDRVAIEHNGSIAARSGWATSLVHAGDKLEIVHFVGGG
jgi:thiamine biosynthesis protein ThiS